MVVSGVGLRVLYTSLASSPAHPPVLLASPSPSSSSAVSVLLWGGEGRSSTREGEGGCGGGCGLGGASWSSSVHSVASSAGPRLEEVEWKERWLDPLAVRRRLGADTRATGVALSNGTPLPHNRQERDISHIEHTSQHTQRQRETSEGKEGDRRSGAWSEGVVRYLWLGGLVCLWRRELRDALRPFFLEAPPPDDTDSPLDDPRLTSTTHTRKTKASPHEAHGCVGVCGCVVPVGVGGGGGASTYTTRRGA